MGLRIALTSVHAWPQVRRGAERYLHELAAALTAAGHRVSVLSTGRPARGTELGVAVRRLRPDTFAAEAFVRLAGARLDVWHATSTGDAVAATAAGLLRPGLRTVFTDHGFPVRASRERRGDARRHAFVARHIGRYVCVSTAAAQWLDTDYGRRAEVVPPGVDTGRFVPGPGRSPTPLVLYVGDLSEPRKGVRSLIDAVAGLPGVALWLVGPGTAPGPAQRCFLADPAELPALYRQAWVTVLPSTAEAFGMALIESLACGTPVVARADGGGPADIVTPGTGVLCDAAPGALAAAVTQALELAAAPSTAAACRSRGELFDWRRVVVPRLEALYAS